MHPTGIFAISLAVLWASCSTATAQNVLNPNSSGFGSLRQVVADAAPGATIGFDPNPLVSGVFQLEGTPIVLDKDVTIDATTLPEGATIDGGGGTIFSIRPDVTVVLEGLTLTGGGQAINNAGTTTLSGCTVRDNTSDSFGGGLFNEEGATLNILESTVSGNTAATSGGGIFNGGTLVIQNSTVAGNTATDGGGGGLLTTGGAVSIIQSTFSANHSATAAGGGIRSFGGILQLRSSIVAGNTSGSGNPDIDGLHFLVDPNMIGGDPLLAPLADYGGPTQTMHPLPGSPVIDPVVGNTDGTDQRGFVRQVGETVDLGAVEFGDLLVNTEEDRDDVLFADGLVSLREAVSAAPPGTTVRFTDDVSGEPIMLEHGQIVIGKDLVIDGSDPGRGVSIDGAFRSRIFQIEEGATVTLRYLNILHGRQVSPSLFSFSVSDEESLGGGILNYGSLRLEYSTVARNEAFTGGGIYSGGSLFMSGSTVGENVAFQVGGILAATTFELVESTVSGNSARTDIFPGLANASSVGGVLFLSTSDEMSLSNSIIAGNHSTGLHPDLFFGTTPNLSLSGTNLVGENIEGEIFAAAAAGGVDGLVVVADPKLAPIGHYGGPTLTMPPLAGSPAIDGEVEPDFLGSEDQRGFARIRGAGQDIGAIEVGDVFLVTIRTDENNFPSSGGNGISLREALRSASFAPGSHIEFDPTVFTGGTNNIISLTLGQIDLVNPRALLVDASNLSEAVVLDAQETDRCLRLSGSLESIFDTSLPQFSAAFHSIHFTNGRTAGPEPDPYSFFDGGGAILNIGSALTLSNCTVSESVATSPLNEVGALGGGVLNFFGALRLNACTIRDCSANIGGGVYLGGELRLWDSIIERNTATTGNIELGGGGIAGEGNLVITNSTLRANSALTGSGGGIWNSDRSTVLRSLVVDNVAQDGGGIFNSDSLELIDSFIEQNHARSRGGGIFNTGSFAISVSVLNANRADNFGGGIYSDSDGACEIRRCTISRNTAGLVGGGIDFRSSSAESALTLSDCTVAENDANQSNGGGIRVNGPGSFKLAFCTISSNTANTNAGVVISVGRVLALSDSIIAGNLERAPSEEATLKGADLLAFGTSTVNATSVNLIGDLTNSGLEAGPTVLTGDPFLAPLGLYENNLYSFAGFETMPTYLPSISPVVNPVGGATTTEDVVDQLGVPRNLFGNADLGAVESVLFDFSPTDTDRDGRNLLLEVALGTDPFSADAEDPRNFSAKVLPDGKLEFSFGFDSAFTDHFEWVLSSSTDMKDFTEFYRYDGQFDLHGPGLQISRIGEMITVTRDVPAGLEPRRYFRLEIVEKDPL